LIHQGLERQGTLAGIGGGDEGFSDRHGRWDGNRQNRCRSSSVQLERCGRVRPGD
jgi:hypothetical protein